MAEVPRFQPRRTLVTQNVLLLTFFLSPHLGFQSFRLRFFDFFGLCFFVFLCFFLYFFLCKSYFTNIGGLCDLFCGKGDTTSSEHNSTLSEEEASSAKNPPLIYSTALRCMRAFKVVRHPSRRAHWLTMATFTFSVTIGLKLTSERRKRAMAP